MLDFYLLLFLEKYLWIIYSKISQYHGSQKYYLHKKQCVKQNLELRLLLCNNNEVIISFCVALKDVEYMKNSKSQKGKILKFLSRKSNSFKTTNTNFFLLYHDYLVFTDVTKMISLQFKFQIEKLRQQRSLAFTSYDLSRAMGTRRALLSTNQKSELLSITPADWTS